MIANSLFQNHELIKLNLQFPILSPLVIYGGVLLLSCAWVKKRTTNQSLLSMDVTNQVRGFAILLVIIGHIGMHVIEHNSGIGFPVLGRDGVSLFFVLSGFGLTRSYSNKPFQISNFIKRRVMKVIVPYWTVTIIILIADYLLLNKDYSISTLLLTTVGVNITDETRHIDYVRWYITLLLIWYFVFGLIECSCKSIKIKSCLFFIAGIVLFFFSYYITPIGYAFLSFPAGVFIGLYYDKITSLYTHISDTILLSLSLISYILIFVCNTYISIIIEKTLPDITISMMSEILLLLFSVSIIIQAELLRNYTSRFLLLAGSLSYSLFLIHSVLMIKYDVILFRGPLFITFWFFLFLIFSISMVTSRKTVKL